MIKWSCERLLVFLTYFMLSQSSSLGLVLIFRNNRRLKNKGIYRTVSVELSVKHNNQCTATDILLTNIEANRKIEISFIFTAHHKQRDKQWVLCFTGRFSHNSKIYGQSFIRHAELF